MDVGGALAQSLPANGGFNSDSFEARFGAFAQAFGTVESGFVDVNGEFVFHRQWQSGDPNWNWLIPPPHVRVMLNTSSKTSYVYGGGLWTYDVTPKLFLETCRWRDP